MESKRIQGPEQRKGRTMRTELNFEDFMGDVSNATVRGRRGRISPTWNDLLVLRRLFETHRPRLCLEIGIHEGHTACLLLEAGQEVSHYVGVDRVRQKPTQLSTPEDPGHLVKQDPRVVLVVRPEGTRGLSPHEVPYQPFDWIFVDADHSYGGVKFDTTWAMPMLRRGGLMVWHDYGVPSQYRPGGPLFGVKKYLDEFAALSHVNITSFADPARTSSIVFMQKDGA